MGVVVNMNIGGNEINRKELQGYSDWTLMDLEWIKLILYDKNLILCSFVLPENFCFKM